MCKSTDHGYRGDIQRLADLKTVNIKRGKHITGMESKIKY